jgi:hypothetical protein
VIGRHRRRPIQALLRAVSGMSLDNTFPPVMSAGRGGPRTYCGGDLAIIPQNTPAVPRNFPSLHAAATAQVGGSARLLLLVT